jgi:Protein of unknown function (DUF2771)
VKRSVAVLLAVVVVVLAAGAGVGAWFLARKPGPHRPEITVYSHGHLTRVGPYMYCNVLDLNDCQNPETVGELRVSPRYPVQLSVPEAISRGPWQLLREYADPNDRTTILYLPGTKLAVTIPTVDPQRGRLKGIVVQLLTVAVDRSTGEQVYPPHAEWSVRLAD